jgi:hypothetical protein
MNDIIARLHTNDGMEAERPRPCNVNLVDHDYTPREFVAMALKDSAWPVSCSAASGSAHISRCISASSTARF